MESPHCNLTINYLRAKLYILFYSDKGLNYKIYHYKKQRLNEKSKMNISPQKDIILPQGKKHLLYT